MRIVDISEPQWCNYEIKVQTKYMCSAGMQMPKISSKFEAYSGLLKDQAEDLAMDENKKTQRKMQDCKIFD